MLSFAAYADSRFYLTGNVISTGAAVLAFSGWELKPEPVAYVALGPFCGGAKGPVSLAGIGTHKHRTALSPGSQNSAAQRMVPVLPADRAHCKL